MTTTYTRSSGSANMAVTLPDDFYATVPFDIHLVASGLHTLDDGSVPSLSIGLGGFPYTYTGGPLGTSSYGSNTFVTPTGSLDMTFTVTIPTGAAGGFSRFSFSAWSPAFALAQLLFDFWTFDAPLILQRDDSRGLTDAADVVLIRSITAAVGSSMVHFNPRPAVGGQS